MRLTFGIGGVLKSTAVLAAVTGVLSVASSAPVSAAGDEAIHIDRQNWSWAGVRGQFDRAQLQRGFQVFQEVCASCHGLKRVYFRNLAEPGGPGFNVEAVKALAASWPNQIFDGPDDQGNIATRKGAIIKRPARLSDPILGPYDNDKQARASQNGALPPDLSIITKARGVSYHGNVIGHVGSMLRDVVNGYQEGGSDYLYALMTGYKPAPADFKLAEGMTYNAAFPGHQIAMIEPLSDGRVKYQSAEVPQTVDQYAHDVAAFLMWAAEPHLEARKRTGMVVLIFLALFGVMVYLTKRKIWSDVH